MTAVLPAAQLSPSAQVIWLAPLVVQPVGAAAAAEGMLSKE
jgi:hypothetical protein